MPFDTQTLNALSRLREYAQQHSGGPVGTPASAVARLVNELDNAGVFHELDAQTGYEVETAAQWADVEAGDEHLRETGPDFDDAGYEVFENRNAEVGN